MSRQIKLNAIPAYLDGLPGKRASLPPLCGQSSTRPGQKGAARQEARKLIDSELIGKYPQEM